VDLKDLLELSAYPAWAKLAFLACIVVMVAILLFAKKARTEDAVAGTRRESTTSGVSEAGRSENRPWIVVESLKLKEPITLRDDYFFMNFIITMRNSGTSTARQVHASIRIATMESARVNEAWNTVIDVSNAKTRREKATKQGRRCLLAM
jgi:hypothetical protein